MKGLSFEDSILEIESIIDNLEQGNLTLDENISLYERGVKLTKYCKAQLDKATLKIDKINSVDLEKKGDLDK